MSSLKATHLTTNPSTTTLRSKNSDLSLEQLLDFYEKIVEMKEITERAIYCKMRMEREGHENN